ncbi:MAG: outer membrane protein assembly factor [Geobacteraceae bacterium]|nr:outer membrane protein assembly factor [Geobacteraceae bacterium]
MRLATRLTLLLIALAMSACTSMVPRDSLPYPLTNEASGEQVKVVAIPLPVIATSPNEGVIAGALTAFLLHNRRDEVTSLLAPQANYNQNFGTTFSLYGALYPDPEQFWEFNLSRSTRVNEDYEVRYINRALLGKKLELNLFPYYFTDGSARFFGFQSQSRKENETNYGDQEYGFTLSAGYQISRHFQLVLGERFRKVNIVQGAVTRVPFIRDLFSPPEVPGIDGFTTHAQKLAIVYSTLNSPTMPTFGGYAKISVENSSQFLGSSADYRHYEAELKGFVPIDDSRYITAFRLVYNQTLGSDVPFLERSILGGETTLRGYGRNRFIDSSYFLLNLEERIRLFRWEIFDVNADWEVAPFIDFGSVMESLDQAETRNFEFNPGIGFRAIVRPNIIGRVDMGFGKDGPAVFVGLGYPF